MPEVHIIDNDTINTRFLTQLLHPLGYHVHCYNSAETFLEREPLRLSEPACLLTELNLPRLSGVVLYERFLEPHLGCPTIFFSQQAEPTTVVHLIKRGVFDFLKKPLEAEYLLDRVRQAVDAHALEMHLKSSEKKFRGLVESLTARERQILQMSLQAMNTKEISHRLNICVKTVSRHRMNLLEKLACKNEMDMVSKMLKFHLVSLEPSSARLEFTDAVHIPV